MKITCNAIFNNMYVPTLTSTVFKRRLKTFNFNINYNTGQVINLFFIDLNAWPFRFVVGWAINNLGACRQRS